MDGWLGARLGFLHACLCVRLKMARLHFGLAYPFSPFSLLVRGGQAEDYKQIDEAEGAGALNF